MAMESYKVRTWEYSTAGAAMYYIHTVPRHKKSQAACAPLLHRSILHMHSMLCKMSRQDPAQSRYAHVEPKKLHPSGSALWNSTARGKKAAAWPEDRLAIDTKPTKI